MTDLISTQSIGDKLDDMLAQVKAFKNEADSSEIIRLLKKYQIVEFAEVFSEDEEILNKIGAIFDEVGERIKERISVKIEGMFNDKQKIEDDFQGFGSEENQRLCEFSFNYLQELMVNYANA